MQQQVAQTQPLITAAAQNLNLAGDAVKDTAGHLSKTADAATVAIQTVTIDAKTANDLLVQLRPLIASYTATGNDLDTTIKTANGIMSSQNVTIMLANGAQFTTTAVQLEQKLSQCTLHPTLPCVLKSDILFGAQVSGYLLR
jgi:ABC-type transporter Mla subunit MlaD